MTTALVRPELELALLGVGGLALLLVMYGIGKASALLPMKKSRRELWTRAQPVLGLLLVFAYLAFAARLVLRDTSEIQPLAFVALGAGFAAAAWFAVRDFVAGVVLKAAKLCQVGDRIRVDETEGRVEDMGLRALVLETSQGEQAIIPYSRIARSAVMRTPAVEGVAMHVFEISAPLGHGVPEIRRAILEAAMMSHYSSIVREPQIKPLGDRRFEVTVFSLHSDYASDIEAAVRRAPLLRA